MAPEACRSHDGCEACTAVCLPHALIVQSSPSPRLILDYSRCIMCGLCVPACPEGALRMQSDYELSVHARPDLLVSIELAGVVRDDNGKS